VPVLVFAALMMVFGKLATNLSIALQMLLGLITIVLLYKIFDFRQLESALR
jgi:hypothetical protein